MDKVGDLLIRIKNGYMASKKEVVVLCSNLNAAILSLLKKEGYIEDYKSEDRGIKVTLKYSNKKASLTDVKRVSKPGRRVYMGVKVLPRVYGGLGIAIVSTPQGVMSGKEARKKGLGGEVMAFVW